jgi:hypothetical protein
MEESDEECDMYHETTQDCSMSSTRVVSDQPGVAEDVNGGKTNDFCWLCEFQGNRVTNEIIRFIMDGIPHMSLEALVTQSKFLLDNVCAESNTTPAQIRRHITDHMLHPRIKLALQLQEMSKMQKDVKKCCVVNDVESGEHTVNPQAMRVYLTLCSQVSALYKVGEDKLIFNNSSMDK